MALSPAGFAATPTTDAVFYTLVFGGVSAKTATLESFTLSTFHNPTVIGPVGYETWYGALAYDTGNSTMYMVDGYGNDTTTVNSSLYTLNLTTGAATLIGSIGMPHVTGLTYDSANDTLYASTTDSKSLLKLNAATGAATQIGSGLGDINVVTYDSSNNVLYGWAGTQIYSVDPATGATTLLSGSGLSSNNSGMVYDPTSNLLWNLDVTGRMATVDPASYVQTLAEACCFSGGESGGLALIPAYTCTNTAAPVITSIDSAGSYGGYSYFASGSWLEIFGSNLADPRDPRMTAAVNPSQWNAGDFTGGVNAPTSLDGISVSINGKAAYVWYISPTQLNVQAPEDATLGPVAIVATNCHTPSQPFMFPRQPLAPGFLAPPNFKANGKQYMVATFASDAAYVLSASQASTLGVNGRPAKPGDVILAYGIGFGDVTPAILPGIIVEQGNTLVNPVTVAFGSSNAIATYQGLAGNFVGLYEFYITVPQGLADGDYQINVAQNGAAVPQTLYLTVKN